MKAGWVLWVALVLGCGAAERVRMPRSINAIGGVVLTNSPALHDEPEPCMRGGRLRLEYTLFAENHGADRAEIDLVAARAALTLEPPEQPKLFRVECLEHEPARRKSPVVVLESGERARIDCHVELPPEQSSELASSDRELYLGVPVRAATEQKVAFFSYQLYAGDVR